MLRAGEDQWNLLLKMSKQLGIFGLLLSWFMSALAGEPWTLERALEQALNQNPDARLARQRIAAAQAGLEQANAAFWPRLQFQSSYTRTDNPMMVFGSILNQRAYPSAGLNFNDVPEVDDLNTRGLVTVPLYGGGKIKAGRETAKANSEAARQENEAVRNALGFEVSRGFYSVLKTRQFIRAAEAAVNSFEASLGTARKRLEGGTLLKSEVLDIEVRLAQAREDLVRARNANALAGRALRNLLGIEEGGFEVAESAPRVTAPDSGDFSRRAELAAARQRERAAQEQVRGAQSGYLPRVSAFGSLDYDYGWRFESGGGSYTAGALVQWDLWDGKLTRAKVREARANLESAREEQRKLRLALDLEVEQARLDLKAANERLAVTGQAVAQASESAGLTRARFEQGAALSTQLIDSETALVAARVRRAEAEADQQIAIAALRKALALPQLEPGSNTERK
jgi:outer membrane protein TolC